MGGEAVRIVKEGDMGRVEKMRRFGCRACGCVFEASDSEYRVDMGYKNDLYCVCQCPTCGKNVTMAYEDGENGED